MAIIKYDLRIPTAETYAYIEIHGEAEDEEGVVEAYFKARDYYLKRNLQRQTADEIPFEDDVLTKPTESLRTAPIKANQYKRH